MMMGPNGEKNKFVDRLEVYVNLINDTQPLLGAYCFTYFHQSSERTQQYESDMS